MQWVDTLGLVPCQQDITRGELDEIIAVKGTVRPEDLCTGTNINAASRAYVRKIGQPTDDAGHTIGYNLGGRCGNDYVFPQNPNVNRGVFNKLEQQIAQYVKSTGRPVEIEQTY